MMVTIRDTKFLVIDETSLDSFRLKHLSSKALLKAIEERVRLLIRVGVGVGKTRAIDNLLQDQNLFDRFDLVIYAAPTVAILNERTILQDTTKAIVPVLRLRPRPSDRCGKLDPQWNALEKCGCSTYAKASLCTSCPMNPDPGGDPCYFPEQLSDLEGVRMIFMTEAQLVLNRSLVFLLRTRTRSDRVLIILDEAKLLSTNFEVILKHGDLDRYREILQNLHPKGQAQAIAIEKWCHSIKSLLEATTDDLSRWDFDFPPTLNRNVFKIQTAGVDTFGTSFRFLGYDLPQLQWSQYQERWKDSFGQVHFIARPYLGHHLLILSAHLTRDYVGHRLGQGPIYSPFENVRFQHLQTRIYNLKNRIGADSYFLKNQAQILDTFAVLVLRNILEKRSTLLISRKKSKKLCATYLENRLAGWGVQVRFVIDAQEELPDPPDPTVIPIIHYGVVGVNQYTQYSTAYCLNSYYVSTYELNRHVQEAEPEHFRVKLTITSGPNMTRRVKIDQPGAQDLDHTFLGNIYLRQLEVDPVIQAAGRVRFLTHPRVVIFFQMHDLSPDLGEYHELRTLQALRNELGIPSAKELDSYISGVRAMESMAEGMTAEEVATQQGVSRRTIFNRLREAKSAKFPIYILYKEILHSTLSNNPIGDQI